MPGDRLVPNPIGMLTNGVTIKAAPAKVWPWIVQIGSGRAGWYSYDWIDNGGHASATSILSDHQQRSPRLLKLAMAYFGHHLMESRMLPGIKRRAERTRLVVEDEMMS